MTLLELLPEKFSFYHLGEVQAQTIPQENQTPAESPPLTPDTMGIGFSLQGDVQAALVLLLDAGLEFSKYSELGNILASQFADGLARENNCDVLVSPPRLLEMAALKRLLAGSESMARKIYYHLDQGSVVKLEVQILYAPTTR